MADLDEILDIGLGNLGRGRKPNSGAPLMFNVSRELTAEDLLGASLHETGIKAAPLKSLRQSHHAIAKLLAQGMRPVEVATTLGVSQSRISILKADPQFSELLAYYSGMEERLHEEVRVDFHKRLQALGADSIEILHERIVDEPDSFKNSELLTLTELVMDRIGHGKTSTVNTNVEHSVSAETLERIRSAAASPTPLAPEDRGALLRLARSATEQHPGSEAPAWIEGEGSLVREEGPEGAPSPLDWDDLLSPVD